MRSRPSIGETFTDRIALDSFQSSTFDHRCTKQRINSRIVVKEHQSRSMCRHSFSFLIANVLKSKSSKHLDPS